MNRKFNNQEKYCFYYAINLDKVSQYRIEKSVNVVKISDFIQISNFQKTKT